MGKKVQPEPSQYQQWITWLDNKLFKWNMSRLTHFTVRVWQISVTGLVAAYVIERHYWKHEEAAGRGFPKIDNRVLYFDRTEPPVDDSKKGKVIEGSNRYNKLI